MRTAYKYQERIDIVIDLNHISSLDSATRVSNFDPDYYRRRWLEGHDITMCQMAVDEVLRRPFQVGVDTDTRGIRLRWERSSRYVHTSLPAWMIRRWWFIRRHATYLSIPTFDPPPPS